MCDNFYCKKGCPAKCGPGFREVTEYRPNTYINEEIRYKNGLNRDDEYRMFLQKNGGVIADNEWSYLRQNNSCYVNECIFNNKRTMVHPSIFPDELSHNNDLLNKNRSSAQYQCKKINDYRLTK